MNEVSCMNKKQFIKTSDIETRNKLLNLGVQEIMSNETNTYVFLNCNKLQFSNDIDLSKIKYSNMLCI